MPSLLNQPVILCRPKLSHTRQMHIMVLLSWQVLQQSVVIVTTTNFNQLIMRMNEFHTLSSSHVVFDLGGHTMHCGLGALTSLKASHVTLRNGTILLGSGFSCENSFMVDGCDVHLQNIIISGGDIGVCVKPGGGVTMRKCKVHDARYGVVVGSNYGNSQRNAATVLHATLEAVDVQIIGYHSIGLTVHPAAKVQLTNCHISGGCAVPDHSPQPVAVLVVGPCSEIVARRLVCTDYVGYGVECSDGGEIVLERCTITNGSSSCGGLGVHGIGSTAELLYCTLSKAPATSEGGIVTEQELVSAGDYTWKILKPQEVIIMNSPSCGSVNKTQHVNRLTGFPYNNFSLSTSKRAIKNQVHR